MYECDVNGAMEAIVIGGGIVGVSSAYYLAERGVDVTLFEKDKLGMGSTGRSAGGIRSQFSTKINVQLSLASKHVWDSFEEQFNVDIGYRKIGYLILARTEELAGEFRKNVEMQKELGADSEFLTPENLTRPCPELIPDDFVAGTFNPNDGIADPNLAVQGYAKKGRELGVEFHTNTTVTGILQNSDQVVGVETKTDKHTADYIINAAGGFAGNVSEMTSKPLPIKPQRRQIVIVDPTKPVPENVPLTIDLEAGSYFRPEREGKALVGGNFDNENETVNPKNYDTSLDMDWAVEAVENAANYTDYFDLDTRIQRGWSGLYAVTPDHQPILEETIPGLITAAGFSGHGFQHAPATGQIVAEIACEGQPNLVNVSELNSRRFDQGATLEEQNVA